MKKWITLLFTAVLLLGVTSPTNAISRSSSSVSKSSTNISKPSSSISRSSTPKASTSSKSKISSKVKSGISTTVNNPILYRSKSDDCDFDDIWEGDDDCSWLFDDEDDEDYQQVKITDRDIIAILVILFIIFAIIVGYVIHDWKTLRKGK